MSENVWRPLGKFVLVRLHLQQSLLDLSTSKEIAYKTTADVVAVGDEVTEVAIGDEVLLNGDRGAIGSKELGEHLALVPLPFLLAKRVDYKSGAGEES